MTEAKQEKWIVREGDSVMRIHDAHSGLFIGAFSTVPYWQRASKEDKRRARIAAAAPDMHEALKAMVAHHRQLISFLCQFTDQSNWADEDQTGVRFEVRNECADEIHQIAMDFFDPPEDVTAVLAKAEGRTETKSSTVNVTLGDYDGNSDVAKAT